MKQDMTPRTPRRPLVWPDTVFDLRDEAGLEGATVYIVGGAVRDAFLGLPVHDLDLTTPEIR
jgi:tRNA nucleotidyltransferase/poly(A) polymerase